jgi:hypothetical protein
VGMIGEECPVGHLGRRFGGSASHGCNRSQQMAVIRIS